MAMLWTQDRSGKDTWSATVEVDGKYGPWQFTGYTLPQTGVHGERQGLQATAGEGGGGRGVAIQSHQFVTPT